LYLEEIVDVGLARSHASPVVRAVLRVVPILENEGRRVDEEEFRNLFSFVQESEK
jgi:hypothetical protein